MSEADYLESQSDGGAADHARELEQDEYFENINRMITRYDDNANSDVGTTIRCATCSKRILKKSYQTQFCSNKGRGNCKDKYWNCSTDKRLHRAQSINRNH